MVEPKLRILFVPDETRVLDGLRISLRKLRNEWDMHFAVGPDEAKAALEGSRFGVVVSDMRMPGTSGTVLLREVSERWPETGRIILSGHAGGEDAEGARVVAHMFLHKPCDVQRLIDAVRQVSRSASGCAKSLPAEDHGTNGQRP